MKPIDIGLKSTSFGPAVPDIPHRIIANVEAREKEGKSTWCLTAPSPIVVFNFDLGLEGIVHHAIRAGKKVIVAGVDQGKHRMPAYFFEKPKLVKGQDLYDPKIVQETANRARVVWRKFKEDFEEALESRARSLVVDTGGAAFQLAKYAKFGKLKRVLPRDHDELYMEFQRLMQLPMNYDKNVLWIHRLGEEWTDIVNRKGEKESIKTGRWVRKSAYRDVGYEVQMNIRLEKSIDKKKKVHYTATVLDSRIGDDMDGETFEDEMCAFPYVAAMVFGDGVEEWE